MNNFKQRTLTGIILVTIIGAAILTGPSTFIALLFIIQLYGLHEFYRLLASAQVTPRKVQGFLLSTSVFVTVILSVTATCTPQIILLTVPVTFIIFTSELFSRSKNPFINLAVTFSGIVCVTLPCLFVIATGFTPFRLNAYHPSILLVFFSIVWASDTGAYLVGKKFGKHLFFKRISPNKTWEGFIGGAFAALITSCFASLFINELSIYALVVIALIVIVAGTFGDLFKSLLKRSVNAKDSGTILPGHGGILDRFDSLFGSAPFVFIFLLFQA